MDTNQFVFMVLGNRTVGRMNINLTDISMEYLKNFGFEKVRIAQGEREHKKFCITLWTSLIIQGLSLR